MELKCVLFAYLWVIFMKVPWALLQQETEMLDKHHDQRWEAESCPHLNIFFGPLGFTDLAARLPCVSTRGDTHFNGIRGEDNIVFAPYLYP